MKGHGVTFNVRRCLGGARAKNEDAGAKFNLIRGEA